MPEGKISHYQILRKLGEGGMGEIYLAEDIKLNRKVALKFLSSRFYTGEEEKMRFILEAQSAASLSHPNICTVYEIDEENNQTFIAMEYIDGETLSDKLKLGPLSIEESLGIVVQIAEGLHEASLKGIVHRDIKSSNIIITKNGTAKITDFGLAKFKNTQFITKPGTTLGTVAYMSPEQASGKDVDLRTDIWSLGVVLYEMLTGELPFKSEYDQTIIYSILNEEPVPPNDIVKNIPDSLVKIIGKMLSKEVGNRYQKFEELIEDFQKVIVDEGLNVKSKFTGRTNKKRNYKKQLLKIALLILAAAVAILIYVVNQSKSVETVNVKLLVLPFQNVGSPDDDYFTEGVFEETLSRLSSINGLSVVPRIKAIQFNKQGNIFEKIRQEYSADYLLEGNVLWNKKDNSDKIKIIINLINVATESIISSDKFTGEFKDIFTIQAEIAEIVAKKLDLKILEPERKAIQEVPTTNMEAYDLYLRAWKIIRNAQSLTREKRVQEYLKSIDIMAEVVRLDSNFYNANASMCNISSFIYDYGYDRSEERKATIRKYMNKVVELRPHDPGTRSNLAIFIYRMDRDFRRAYNIICEIHKEYPNYNILWQGIIERRLGLWQEAIEHLKEAEKLAPNVDDTPLILGDVYTLTREFDLANKAFDRSLKIHPAFIYAVQAKSLNYFLWNGDLQRARNVWKVIENEGKKELFWLFIYRMERNYKEILTMLDSVKNKSVDMNGEYFVKFTEYAQTYYLMKNYKLAKSYSDSAITYLKTMSKDKSGDAAYCEMMGMSYALGGDKKNALLYGLKAIRLCPMDKDTYESVAHLLNFAKIQCIVGNSEETIEQLKYLLSVPLYVSKAYLKTEPIWDPIRNSETFQKLIAD